MKPLLAALLLSLTVSLSFGQLNDISATTAFVTNPSFSFGLDSLDLTTPTLQMQLTVNDINDVGRIVATIYDSENRMLDILDYDQTVLENQPVINDNKIIFNFRKKRPSESYTIIIQPQNSGMAYLEFVTVNYTGN